MIFLCHFILLNSHSLFKDMFCEVSTLDILSCAIVFCLNGYVLFSSNRMEKDRPSNAGFRRGANKPQGARGGKRVFDRRSGMTKSGVKPQEKRQGSGPRNWGSDKETEFFSQDSKSQEKVTTSKQLIL